MGGAALARGAHQAQGRGWGGGQAFGSALGREEWPRAEAPHGRGFCRPERRPSPTAAATSPWLLDSLPLCPWALPGPPSCTPASEPPEPPGPHPADCRGLPLHLPACAQGGHVGGGWGGSRAGGQSPSPPVLPGQETLPSSRRALRTAGQEGAPSCGRSWSPDGRGCG